MIRYSVLAAIAIAALQSAAPAFGADSTTTIHFAHHATEATLSGGVKGYDSANFLIGAKAGQEMKVSFRPSNASCYINVWPPGQRPGGSGSAIFIGSTEGNEFGGTLSQDGTYMVQAYLMRNEARRGTTCKFDLVVSITGGTSGGSAGNSGASVTDDQMRAECKGGAAGLYGIKPVYITLDNEGYIFPATDGYSIEGKADKGNEGIKSFNCIFEKSRKLKEVMPLDSDGE